MNLDIDNDVGILDALLTGLDLLAHLGLRQPLPDVVRVVAAHHLEHHRVVREGDRGVVQALLAVDFLLALEDLVDERLVQLLIRVVDLCKPNRSA